MEIMAKNISFPSKNIPQTTIPVGSSEFIVSYLRHEERKKEFPIAMMGVSRLKGNYIVCRMRTYQWHVLIYIRKGDLYFRNDAIKNSPMRKHEAGTLLFLPAHSIYTYGSADKLELTWFHLNPDAATWHFLNGIGICHEVAEEDKQFRSLIMLLYREHTLGVQQDSNICYHTGKLIEHMLVRKLKSLFNETEAMRKIRKLFESIELSLNKNWTVCEMAKQCGISQSALFMLSQQCFGQSPIARLETLRMTVAANLLNNSELKLDAIASMVGLSTGFSLSRAFKRFHGLSPREYKKRLALDYLPSST
jgi:AraC-like DNA-binding protein